MTLTKPEQYCIYTDGAAPDNQNGCSQGGIGVAILDGNNNLIDSYKETIKEKTTNIRMEMLALIKGLELSGDLDVIYTDLEILVKGYNLWLDGWKAKGWRGSNRSPVKNLDLWLRIDQLRVQRPSVKVVWVKGHSGIIGNGLANELAQGAASGL